MSETTRHDTPPPGDTRPARIAFVFKHLVRDTPPVAAATLLAHLLAVHGDDLLDVTCHGYGPVAAPPACVRVVSAAPTMIWQTSVDPTLGAFYVTSGLGDHPQAWCAFTTAEEGLAAFRAAVASRKALWRAACAGDLPRYATRLMRVDKTTGLPPFVPATQSTTPPPVSLAFATAAAHLAVVAAPLVPEAWRQIVARAPAITPALLGRAAGAATERLVATQARTLADLAVTALRRWTR